MPFPQQQARRPAVEEGGLSFRDVLSALNPLQYVPVAGTIYRALTGDQIPEAMRRVGSIVVSGLLGGPIGAAINLATVAAEKAAGIDLDGVGQTIVAALDPTGAPATDEPANRSMETAAESNDLAAPWSVAQLAAYGVSSDSDGILRLGRLSGADVLNDLQLSRMHGETGVAGGSAAPVMDEGDLPDFRMAQTAYERLFG